MKKLTIFHNGSKAHALIGKNLPFKFIHCQQFHGQDFHHRPCAINFECESILFLADHWSYIGSIVHR